MDVGFRSFAVRWSGSYLYVSFVNGLIRKYNAHTFSVADSLQTDMPVMSFYEYGPGHLIGFAGLGYENM